LKAKKSALPHPKKELQVIQIMNLWYNWFIVFGFFLGVGHETLGTQLHGSLCRLVVLR
jgi:hypothetical protein